jgi:sulfate adenylyltransferase subunit 1
MDLVDYSEEVFNNIAMDFAEVAKSLGLKDVRYIPISALDGDNIVEKGNKFSWYEGDSLLHVLETIEVDKDINYTHARFPVQYVIRPQTEELHDYRGYAGKILSGKYKKGDRVLIQPSGVESTISVIEKFGTEVDEAVAHQSVVIHLQDDVDVSRGDLIVKKENAPQLSQQFEVFLCWMDTKPLINGNKYLLQLNSRTVRCVVKEIEYKLDVNTLEKKFAPSSVELNDIIRATIKTASPLPYDSYKELRENGGAILIDETSFVTVAACLIQSILHARY